ncbi:DUF4177 domain-containing protein [Croceiramulus getboli]|nr:DUF4177 domain-containing protein [Flavobacteriaceae bacterium YJPT1-3]
MKEYKVVSYKMRLSKNNQHLEDFLNSHAISGWSLKAIDDSWTRIILERNKNR